MINYSSKRLYVRQIQISDHKKYIETVAEDEVMRYISGKGLTKDQAKAKFNSILKENAQDPRFGGFILSLRADQTFVGMAKFSKTAVDELEIGYMFLPKYWGARIGH
jgi:ribosomal-protein-alanine N-acetyltransferase